MRTRIVAAAARLLAEGGRDAATTRAVASAAGVQAPTIYRLFGDKRGLLHAVAQEGFAAYLAEKVARPPNADPVQDLREGWDAHVAFGLTHPELFAILAGDARPPTPAFAAGLEVLQRRIRNIALAGRLRVSEARAMALVQAMGTGTVLTLLRQGQRDPALASAACDAMIAAIVSDPVPQSDPGARVAASSLRASLDQTAVLSDGERLLLGELLDRIADAP